MRYLTIFILLLILLTREFFYLQEHHIYKENDEFKISYSFTHEPKKNSLSQYFFSEGVLVTLPLYPSYRYGDVVLLDGTVSQENSNDGNLLVVKNPHVTKVEKQNLLMTFSKNVRKKVENAVLTTLPSREGGLLLGIILGVRDKIDNTYYEMLKNAGVLHVIAASGQNVSIAAALLFAIFEKIVKRRSAILFTGVGILLYAVLAGFDPPIVRASIMALLAFAALFSGRQTNSLYILCLTGWIMLVYQPQEASDVSFQLSFLSTFGIIAIKPMLDRVGSFGFLSILKEDITTTLSAQIATFPVMLASFGAYSLLSFPINILILWTVPIIMIFGGLGAILSFVFLPAARIFILLCEPFLAYFTGVIVSFSNIKYGISIDTMPILILIGYYLILLAIVIRFGKLKTLKR
jgi:competence protein ComEC